MTKAPQTKARKTGKLRQRHPAVVMNVDVGAVRRRFFFGMGVDLPLPLLLAVAPLATRAASPARRDLFVRQGAPARPGRGCGLRCHRHTGRGRRRIDSGTPQAIEASKLQRHERLVDPDVAAVLTLLALSQYQVIAPVAPLAHRRVRLVHSLAADHAGFHGLPLHHGVPADCQARTSLTSSSRPRVSPSSLAAWRRASIWPMTGPGATPRAWRSRPRRADRR